MLYRLYSAISDKNLAKTLVKLMGRPDVSLTSAKRLNRVLPELSRQNCDMFILGLDVLPDPPTHTLEMLRELPENPAIVILVEADNPLQRASYLAHGADAVLETGLEPTQLADAINALIDSRIDAQSDILTQRTDILGPRIADFVSASAPMQAFMKTVQKVVRSDSSLLLLGETGVGKERLARAVHEESPRSNGPFMPVNCAALPENLLESELFGHEMGAFTGATRTRRGVFELAHQGTVFLDEIGDMPLHLQSKLLRVLQERQFTRVGGEKPIQVDVRVMAATNIDLRESVQNKEFRQDLYYRISVVVLEIPPLRCRHEDIPELADSYIQYFASKIPGGPEEITEPALVALQSYDWPGNVRELINVIERAVLLAEGDSIELEDLPEEISGRSVSNHAQANGALGLASEQLPEHYLNLPWKDCRTELLNNLEKAYLTGLLARNNGRIDQTAEEAGMNPRSLYDKMKLHGIDKRTFRD